ncbi:MAG: radical SAM protein [Candidatus Gastranaerophilales bacterium]|nr:radical SAM protein [Candidatus Gastranaerophilales bacterium]
MKYLGCDYMEHGLSFEYKDLYDCCMMHHDNLGMPLLIKDYNGEKIDWDKIFDIKRERIERQKIKTIPECEGCYYLKEKEFTEEKYISEVAFQQIKLCNAKCVYCGDDFRYHKNYYDVYPVIKDLVEKGYFRRTDYGLVIFQGGEPTIMNHFDDLIALFNEHNANIKVNTSAIRFSEVLAKGMETGNILTCISIDSGCRETYNKVKYVDKFDVVCNSIRKYSDAANVSQFSKLVIKYLLTPGYNDSVEEIDLFFAKMKELNIKNVVFDVEAGYSTLNHRKDVSPHIHYLLDYAKKCAENENMNFEIFSFAFYVEQERQIPYSEEIIADKAKLIETVNKYKIENVSKNKTYAIPANYFVD